MAVKSLYLTNAVAPGANHGALQDGGSPPALATTGTGWTVGTEPAGDEASLDWGSEVARTTFATTAMPAATINNTIGDSVRSVAPFSGAFAGGDWVLHLIVRAVTAGGEQDGHVKARLWKGSNPTGSGATEFGSLTDGTNVTNLATTGDQVSTVTWSGLAGQTFVDEYLFVQMAWEVTGAGGGTTRDVLLRVGTSGADTAGVVTPDFTQSAVPYQVGTAILLGAGTGATLTFTSWPTGIATDDVVVVHAGKENNTDAYDTISGWSNLVQGTPGGAEAQRMLVAVHRYTSGDGSPAFTWTPATSVWRSAMMTAWRGCWTGGDAWEPAPPTLQTNTGATATVTATGITTSVASCRLLMPVTNFDGAITHTPTTAGLIEDQEYDNQTLNYGTQTAAGGTGDKVSTMSAADTWSTTLLALMPTGGAPAQDAPERRGRPFGQRGAAQQQQLLAQ